MPMSPKENYLNCLLHKETEWTPIAIAECAVMGFGATNGPWVEKGPIGGGKDAFGVNWVCPASGSGAPIPEPGNFILNIDNFLQWRDYVKIPNVDDFDWEMIAKEEFDNGLYDPDYQALEFGCGNGVFERLSALMGFEDALIAMVEEPEEVKAFFEEVTDYKIAMAKKIKDFYHPDIFNNYDDIATERGPFMSQEVYRELIKPYHKRLNDAVWELDMIPIQHTCGKCDVLIEDFIETGAAAWSSVQPTNDIEGMLAKYGDKISLIGGFDTNGRPGRADATLEERLAEVNRCIETYGKYDAYILFCFIIVNTLDLEKVGEALMPLVISACGTSHQLGRTNRIK